MALTGVGLHVVVGGGDGVFLVHSSSLWQVVLGPVSCGGIGH
jgi:hypothetical protein